MRILGVFPAYEPAWAFGGVVRCTSNLFRAMAKLGVDVTVYTTNASGNGEPLSVPTETDVNASGVRVRYFPSSFCTNATFHSRKMAAALGDSLRDFDILYTAAIWQWIGISAARRARQAGIPCVIGPHGAFLSAALQRKCFKKALFWHICLKQAVAGAAAIHFASEFERDASRRFVASGNSFVVPNPLSVGGDDPAKKDSGLSVRARFGIPGNSFVLLTVARAHPDKRLDILIESLSSLPKHDASVRLLVVGQFDNLYGRKLRALAGRLKVADLVVWAGYQSGRDLEACYRESDLFVLPSAHENFCMAAAEAMSHGLPAIVSRHVGIAHDIERHRAGLVTDIDAAQVTNAVLTLMADADARRQMATRARDIATRLYSGEHTAKLMVRAFEDVLSGSRSPECAWQRS